MQTNLVKEFLECKNLQLSTIQAMYIRVSSLTVVRAGRNLCRISTMIALMICVLVFIFLFTLIQSDHPIPDGSHVFNREAELSTWTSNQSLMLEDYIDLTDRSTFIHEPYSSNLTLSYCGPDIKVLVMVASAPGNFKARMGIRNTWGSRENLLDKGGRILFVLGSSQNSTIDELVSKEVEEFGDIVEESFHDTYHNLTLKTMAMLKWINLTCPTIIDPTSLFAPKYFLKTDDDIFINFDRILRVLHDLPNAKMIGRLTCGAIPIADPCSKLYMPKYIYPDKVYPGYLSGTAYVLRTEIIPTLLENSLIVPLIHLEDIYVTGLIGRESHIYPDDSPFFTYNRLEPKDTCAFRFMVNSHQMTPQEMELIWTQSKSPPTVPCNIRRAKWLRKIPRLTKRLKTLCKFL